MSGLIEKTTNDLFQEAVRLLNIRAMILGDDNHDMTADEIVREQVHKKKRGEPIMEASVVEVPGKGKRRMSAAARRSIGKAQRERWARWRKAKR